MHTADFGGAPFWCAAAVAAASVLLVRQMRGMPIGTAALVGLAGLATAATLQRAATLWEMNSDSFVGPGTGPMLTAAWIQLGLAVAVAVAGTSLAAIRIRRLPPVTYQPAGPPITA